MCSRRVFANSNCNNFIDYNNSKNGNQIYKNIQSKGNNVNDRNYLVRNNELINILNYEMYLTLTKDYYKRLELNDCNLSPLSINESKKSVLNNTVPTNNNNNNDDCKKCSNNDCNCNNNNNGNNSSNCTVFPKLGCDELKNVLYPYGNYKGSCKSYGYVYPSKMRTDVCKNPDTQQNSNNYLDHKPCYVSSCYGTVQYDNGSCASSSSCCKNVTQPANLKPLFISANTTPCGTSCKKS